MVSKLIYTFEDKDVSGGKVWDIRYFESVFDATINISDVVSAGGTFEDSTDILYFYPLHKLLKVELHTGVEKPENEKFYSDV